MALRYLMQIEDLTEPSPALVEQLCAELDEIVARGHVIVRLSQLAISGLLPDQAYSHRGVRLRRLTESERGSLLEMRSSVWSVTPTFGSDFVQPRRFTHGLPTALLEIETERAPDQLFDQSTLPARVVLAFFLRGHALSSDGVMASFDKPMWAGSGINYPSLPLTNSATTAGTTLTLEEFQAVINLAFEIPSFGGAEGSGKEIVLFRVLRGFGMSGQESGLLDFAIALEAALLSGTTDELSFRFALYGALFLRDLRDPRTTYDQLRNIYRVRSKLVHGTRVNATHRAAAETDAAELSRSVVLRAVEEGWPDGERLEEAALGIRFDD